MGEPRITRPGAYSVTADDYHADAGMCPEPSLSSTGARAILPPKGCPAQFWYDRANPKPPSVAFKVGSAAHEYLLEGETWPQRHFVLPDDHNGRTNAGKALVASAESRGLRVIRHDEFEAVKGMRDALAAHPFAMAAFTNGKAEQSIYWRDEDFGIWCRCRPDFLPRAGTIVADYKTSDDVAPDELRKDIWNYGYAQQAAWYLDGIKAVGLIEKPSFLFVFQCKRPPYLIVPVMLDQVALDWGDVMNRKARATFARCLRTGRWPGYADDIVPLGLPGWAESELVRKHQDGAFDVAADIQRPLGIEAETETTEEIFA